MYNQKFTNTKPPKGNITSNKIGNGSFSHPDDLKMIPGSLQYENQMRRFENAKGLGSMLYMFFILYIILIGGYTIGRVLFRYFLPDMQWVFPS